MLEELFDLSQRFIKNYYREYRRYFLKKYPLESRFSIIIGPKGVGKSTAIIQYLFEFAGNDRFSRDILYIQADHFLMRQHTLYEIVDRFDKEGGKLVCFDEIHKYPDWSRELKSIYDTFPGIKMIASGSSALAIHKGSHDLSRRAIVYLMHTMSFREYLELAYDLTLDHYSLQTILEEHRAAADRIVEKLKEKGLRVLPLFQQYLEYGCYPYFKEYTNKEFFHIALEQGIHTVVEIDLIAMSPGLDGAAVKKIKQLLAFIAGSVPFTPDLKKIKQILGIGDERTLKNYLQYLENGGIILNLSKKAGGLKVLEKPDKIFLNDTNLMYAVGARENLQKGNIRENFFANTLSADHRVTIPDKGDFLVDGVYTFEVGGKGKGFDQIKDMKNSFLSLDDIEIGVGNKIPLWLFGFLF
ncbi:MAG: AAA family ATPase [Candidatus Aminicenantes bacterium]|nr:AAA family ATPase [Candidatus Aminicenantes bacterium]